MPRFLRILFRPEATWQDIRAADPSWSASLVRHALPLAVLPAIAWPVGQALLGPAPTPAGLVTTALITFALSLASVALVALGIYVLAPLYGVARQWNRSAAVAAYASTPVLLAGALLLAPVLVIAAMGAFLYALGLCSLGLQQVLDCRSGEVAGFLAAVAVFVAVTSSALGALCSAIGLI